MKCCRKTPRCADCPARRIAEAKVLLALGIPPGPPLPPHLEGVPRSLHKYEPLLRKSWEERRRAERVA
ncbi:MAG TPA: hypothetical protein VK307_06810 [Thermoleophilaceae bacterium]|nr:hypothetical protein [Thermoleophilaceae bacterium]